MRPGDPPPRAILDLVHRLRDLEQRAAQQYRPRVDDILRTGNRDAQTIEHTLDGMLEFCGYGPVLQMYRKLCQHYWLIDPAATAFYVEAYRERWDADEPGDPA